MIIYFVILYETYKNKTFIFTPYKPPPPPNNSFFPLGKVTKMTPDEIATRNRIINASLTPN